MSKELEKMLDELIDILPDERHKNIARGAKSIITNPEILKSTVGYIHYMGAVASICSLISSMQTIGIPSAGDADDSLSSQGTGPVLGPNAP